MTYYTYFLFNSYLLLVFISDVINSEGSICSLVPKVFYKTGEERIEATSARAKKEEISSRI